MKRYVPKYIQLLEALKKEIALCNVGDRFHTHIEIMRKYGLSCATVSRALDELVVNGMLHRLRGKGTFVASTVPTQRAVSSEYPDLALCFCSAKNPLTDIENLNWFLYAQLQQGVVNNYRGRCTIYYKQEFCAAVQSKLIKKAILYNPDTDTIKMLEKARIPYVGISQNQCHWNNNSIQINHMTGIIEAMNYLHSELGHSRIALITTGTKPHSDRLAAYKIARHTLGLKNSSKYIYFTEQGTLEAGKAAIKELMSLPQPPTAILVDTDLKAFGVLEWLAEQNISVPETVSLIGFDNREECNLTTPQLTSIDCSFISIGKMAVAMLDQLVQSNKLVIANQTFMTSLVIRKSCAAVKKSK